jgi:Lrp/AsnC family leucine-responsive transcriptional regulator
MIELDVKDRKILYQLDLDSRQSFRSLGKKVGLSKDVVTSRVKKLQEKEVIKGFHAVVDYSRVGFNLYRFYFSFQNVTPELKQEIISYFCKNKYSDDVASLEGVYDLLVVIFVKNNPEAYEFWQQALKRYGKYFSQRVFTAFCHGEYYANRFLVDQKEFTPKRIYQWLDTGKRLEIDEVDYQIIKDISKNSRVSTVKLAQSMDLTAVAVNNRLKKLLDEGIIIAYRLGIDFKKIGYFWYKVNIELNQFESIDGIVNYLKANPHFSYICRSIGYVDLEVGLILRNTHELRQIMEDVSSRFPDAIKDYSYFYIVKYHKAFGF